MNGSWKQIQIPYLKKSVFINSSNQLCSSGKIQLNAVQRYLIEKIISGGYDLDDLASLRCDSSRDGETALKERVKSVLVAYFRATDFIDLVEMNLPPEVDMIMVDRGWGGVFVHAIDLWEKLNRKYKYRALLIAPTEPFYGFDERLRPWLITPRAWGGNTSGSDLVSFVNITRTILKKVRFKLLFFSHRILTPYFFDIIKSHPTIIHADGYFESVLRVGEHLAPDPPPEALTEILQELYYGHPDYTNVSSSLIHLKGCYWSFKYAAENWFWCEPQRAIVLQDFPQLAERFKVVLPLIDTHRFRPAKQEVKEDCILFTTTYGRYGIGKKGIHEVLQAFKRLPAQAKLKIVVHSQDVLPAEVRELGNRVEVLTSVPKKEMANIYRSCIANCRVSRDESSPVSILESMACGLPVVVSPIIAANIPIIEDGVTGFVVDPDDIDGLVRKLHVLLCDAEKRRWMGRQARKRMLRYSIDKNIREIIKYFIPVTGETEMNNQENLLTEDMTMSFDPQVVVAGHQGAQA